MLANTWASASVTECHPHAQHRRISQVARACAAARVGVETRVHGLLVTLVKSSEGPNAGDVPSASSDVALDECRPLSRLTYSGHVESGRRLCSFPRCRTCARSTSRAILSPPRVRFVLMQATLHKRLVSFAKARRRAKLPYRQSLDHTSAGLGLLPWRRGAPPITWSVFEGIRGTWHRPHPPLSGRKLALCGKHGSVSWSRGEVEGRGRRATPWRPSAPRAARARSQHTMGRAPGV